MINFEETADGWQVNINSNVNIRYSNFEFVEYLENLCLCGLDESRYEFLARAIEGLTLIENKYGYYLGVRPPSTARRIHRIKSSVLRKMSELEINSTSQKHVCHAFCWCTDKE